MIYLIGGPSRSGKTILAKMLQQKTGANLLPLDYIEAAVTEYYSNKELDELRPFSAMRSKTNRECHHVHTATFAAKDL
jgi:predicted kinase